MRSETLIRDEKEFQRGKLLFYSGIGCYAELMIIFLSNWHNLMPDPFHSMMPFLKEHHWTLILSVIFANAGPIVFFGYARLDQLYERFLKEPAIRDAALALHHISGQPMRCPTFAYFVVSSNLEDFEQKVVRLYGELRKQSIKVKHIQQMRQNAIAAVEKMEDLDRQFQTALLAVTTEAELKRYRNRYIATKNFDEARSVIRELNAKSEKQETAENQQVIKRKRLIQMLADLSSDGICPESAVLLKEAQENPYIRQANDALKKAITAQKAANRKNESPIETDAARDDLHPLTPTERTLDLSNILPQEVDSEMASQTLIALGTDRKSHAALRLVTAELYKADLGKRFPARSFDDTLGWLIRERILLEKKEGVESVYALNSRTTDRTCCGITTAVIREVTAFQKN